jgi:hypothetical protein
LRNAAAFLDAGPQRRALLVSWERLDAGEQQVEAVADHGRVVAPCARDEGGSAPGAIHTIGA